MYESFFKSYKRIVDELFLIICQYRPALLKIISFGTKSLSVIVKL